MTAVMNDLVGEGVLFEQKKTEDRSPSLWMDNNIFW